MDPESLARHLPGMGYSRKYGFCVSSNCPDPEKKHLVTTNVDMEIDHTNGIALCYCKKDTCLIKKETDLICRSCVFVCPCKKNSEDSKFWLCSEEALNKCEDCGTSTCEDVYIYSSCSHFCYYDSELEKRIICDD